MCGRDTEDELAKVADERDDAKKEREEVKWQARQADKRAAAAEEELDSVRQVAACLAGCPRRHVSSSPNRQKTLLFLMFIANPAFMLVSETEACGLQ